jgi:hypothetical protein
VPAAPSGPRSRPFWTLVVPLIALGIGACSDRLNGDDAPDGPPRSPRFEKPGDALLADHFSKDGLSGWKPDMEGVWQVRGGVLMARLPDKKQQRSFLRAGDASWTDYAVDLDVCMTRGVDKGVVVRVKDDEGVGVDLRGPGYDDVLVHRGMARLGKASVRNANGKWHHIRVEARGPRYRVFVNGKRVLEAEDADRASGGIALAAYTGGSAKCTVYYDNVAVTKLEP